MSSKVKIVSAPFGQGYENGTVKVAIESMSITYVQDIDDCQTGDDDIQSLTIKAHPSPGGSSADGCYFYTVESSRWAVDSVEEFTQVFNDFVSRLENTQKNN